MATAVATAAIASTPRSAYLEARLETRSDVRPSVVGGMALLGTATGCQAAGADTVAGSRRCPTFSRSSLEQRSLGAALEPPPHRDALLLLRGVDATAGGLRGDRRVIAGRAVVRAR